MEGSSDGGHKRRREEFEAAGSPEISSPEAKRFLLDMLDDDAEAGEQDLASIMKSLEQEIALPSPPPPAQAPADRPDLEFLLEASDDELGLPPPSEETGAGGVSCAGELEEPELGEVWGFDDDGILGFEGFECGKLPEEEEEEEKVEEGGVSFEEGLLEYADVAVCGSSDFADLSWRPKTLPAV